VSIALREKIPTLSMLSTFVKTPKPRFGKVAHRAEFR